jgi:hypothetical protein
MKTECGRFEYQPEVGIFDNLCARYITMTGEVKQIKGMPEVRLSEATKKLIQEFIAKIAANMDALDAQAKIVRLNSNQNIAFNKKLNEGYSI